MVSWGNAHPFSGGDSSSVQASLQDVREIQADDLQPSRLEHLRSHRVNPKKLETGVKAIGAGIPLT